MTSFDKILAKPAFSRQDIVRLLKAENEEKTALFSKANAIRHKYVGNKVFLRGLIEFSNICTKNCYYCGIRHDNPLVNRYNLSDKEIIAAAGFAFENRFGSIVLQSGENNSTGFVNRIDLLLKKLQKLSGGNLRITLSLGEQTRQTYRRWLESGAHRYLLRIESSNPELYKKLHPPDENHRFEKRMEALNDLKETGYQTGTGVMIGLPFQTTDDLAGDLIFMKDFNIDMVGMGPYIEHMNTPLYEYRHLVSGREERFQLTLKMTAILRIMMKEINIASTTALQAIDTNGREKALEAGANVIMPNITPGHYRDDYLLYEDKPCTNDIAEDYTGSLEARIALTGNTIAYNDRGDSKHFIKRKQAFFRE
ncbi:MAG: [FeFe] hydrogenase H-cluster radical SAM maturase HydE [Bacteroidales bacterium]|nr:[FeFe] hydrogenase H-cluster radical SAM maturase HydE [Bacteroidales bacterium]